MPYELPWRPEAGNGELCFSWRVQAGGADRVALGLPTAHGVIHAVVDARDPLAALHVSDDPMAAVKKPALITLDPAFVPVLILEPLPGTWARIGRLRAQPWRSPPPYVALDEATAPTFWNGPQSAPSRHTDEALFEQATAGLEALSFGQRLSMRPAVWSTTRALRSLAPGAGDPERVELVHQLVLRLDRATEGSPRTPQLTGALHGLLDGLAAALGLPAARGAREASPTRITHWGDWARTF